MKNKIKNTLVALISAAAILISNNSINAQSTNNISDPVIQKYKIEKVNNRPESKTISYDLNWQRINNSYLKNYSINSPFLINLGTKYDFSLKNDFDIPLSGNISSQGSMYSTGSRENYYLNLNCNLVWEGPISLSARTGRSMILNSSMNWDDLVLGASKNISLGRIDKWKFSSNQSLSTYWYNNSKEDYSNWRNISFGSNILAKKKNLSLILSYNYLVNLNLPNSRENHILSTSLNYNF